MRRLAAGVVMAIGVSISAQAQEALPPAPEQAFRAVHMLNIPAGKEGEMLAMLQESNAVMVKLGCADCRYRLWKVYGTQTGTHQYLWDSTWPSREVYNKIHDAPEWRALQEKLSKMPRIPMDEVYNRFVEIVPKK